MVALQGEFDRGRYLGNSAQHHRQAGAWLAGLTLDAETALLRDTAFDFFREKAPVAALRKLRDEKDPVGFSRSLWREIASLGWASFLVPEEFGGADFGHLGLGQVMEAAGRTLAATPLLSTALIGASALR